MTTTALTVGAHDSVREAASRMLEARVDSLPVVDEAGNMTGIVTAHDILAMVRDDR
jgi:CBS domain-containing protein